jgi:hypothetical protein
MMHPWLISWIVFCAVGLAFPCCLLVFAWHRNRTVTSPLIVPMIAVLVLALAMVPAMRSAILGGDYSRRMFVTIDVFAALTLINAIYAATRKAWAIAIASVVLLSLGSTWQSSMRSFDQQFENLPKTTF